MSSISEGGPEFSRTHQSGACPNLLRGRGVSRLSQGGTCTLIMKDEQPGASEVRSRRAGEAGGVCAKAQGCERPWHPQGLPVVRVAGAWSKREGQ